MPQPLAGVALPQHAYATPTVFSLHDVSFMIWREVPPGRLSLIRPHQRCGRLLSVVTAREAKQPRLRHTRIMQNQPYGQ